MKIQIDNYDYLNMSKDVEFESTDNENLATIKVFDTEATVSVVDLLAVARALITCKEEETK